jgi:hypothetical protein
VFAPSSTISASTMSSPSFVAFSFVVVASTFADFAESFVADFAFAYSHYNLEKKQV